MVKSLSVRLSKKITGWIDRQVATGVYATSDALIQDAVRTLQRRAASNGVSRPEPDESLEAKLLEALDSGSPIPATPAFWRELRREGRRTLVAAGRHRTAGRRPKSAG